MINVLCLHGCGGDRDSFRYTLRRFRHRDKHDGVRYIFCDAPYDNESGGKKWYETLLSLPPSKEYLTYNANDCADTLDIIARDIIKYDIHVLLGFSQGANVIDTFLSHRNAPSIKCAVLLSGYSFASTDRCAICVPILVATSSCDTAIPSALQIPQKGMALIHHTNGHAVDRGRNTMRKIIQFIRTYGNREGH